MRRLPAPFAFLVPCLGLIVSLTILAAFATLLYFSLQQMARGGSNAYLHAGNFSMTIPRERFVMFAITSAAVRFGHIVDRPEYSGHAWRGFIFDDKGLATQPRSGGHDARCLESFKSSGVLPPGMVARW